MQYFCNSSLSALANLQDLEGKTLKVAGIVSEAKHLVSNKNNKPFGFFTLEDYNGEYEFRLFDQDYLHYKAMMEKGWYLHITCTSEPSRYRPGEYQLKIKKIELLSNMWDTKAKGLLVNVALERIDERLLMELDALHKEHHGDKPLKIRIHSENLPQVDVMARKLCIKLEPRSVRRVKAIFKSKPEVLFQEN
jgi:DNA polymerase-3 subunit alpha